VGYAVLVAMTIVMNLMVLSALVVLVMIATKPKRLAELLDQPAYGPHARLRQTVAAGFCVCAFLGAAAPRGGNGEGTLERGPRTSVSA
jgi:hypothetical protein